ncbi:MAG: UDP-N-acetylmuramate dehydrogenase [Desulfomonilia bacterium]|jgi:UDP-N-acetylmuramate dehydrogenase
MKEYRSVKASELTTMRCGGTIDILYEPETQGELQALVTGLERYVLIGAGSNLIFPDGLITTPVIRLGAAFSSVEPAPGGIRAGGAAPLARVLDFCRKNALAGLEFLSGIPGTVGGALCMNAGTAETGIMERLIEAEYVDCRGVHSAARESLPYRYRSGGFDDGAIIVSALLMAHSDSADKITSAMRAYLDRRKNQPGGFSCGSVFKNPPGQAAGRLIEQAGLKGFRIGGAAVSEVHANFIINEGNATSADIRSLVRAVKERVKDRFGIELEEEVKILDERL